VLVNEIASTGGVPGDWVELYNDGTAMADLSGWTLLDNDDTHVYTFSNGTMLVPGDYLVVEEATFGFGLGASDSVRLFDAMNNLIDTYVWTNHAATTYGRCPNGKAGTFQETINATKGGPNDC
jgi:hypothetical protein